MKNTPQEGAITILQVGPERNARSAVALRANGDSKLPSIEGRPLAKRVFTATYYDTAERRLARAGISLRRRMESGNNVWELELPRESEPVKLDAPGGPAGPPPVLARLLSGVLRGAPLEEVRRTRTRRSGVRVASGGLETVEALIDSISVLDGRRVEEEFTEISLRQLDGDTRQFRALSKELRNAGARPLQRAQEKKPQHADANAGVARVRAVLDRQLTLMLAHDPGVRLGDDPEDVHRLRVATRRFRAVLRAARPFFAAPVDDLRSDLAWMADLLGSVRDLDVLIEQLRKERTAFDLSEQAGAAQVVDLLVAEREAARAKLVTAMRTKRYARLLTRLEELVDGPISDKKIAIEPLARKEFKKLRKTEARLTKDASDEDLHRVRVHAKRARYTAELAERAVGKRATRFITRAKRFQDVAGELQDSVVAEQKLRALSAQIDESGAAFSAGRLLERAQSRRAAARQSLPAAWAKVEKAGSRAWN